MKVGLVLGAGGVMGGAWLTGGLQALAEETGWDPGSADIVVGTSAGSMIGALCVGGVPPWFMVAHSAGESFEGVVDEQGRPASSADRAAGAVFRPQPALPRLFPGSFQLAARSALRPLRHTPSTVVAGWLPWGVISTEPLKDVVRRVVPSGWVEHPNLWVVACDYATGRRVAFGRSDAPEVDLADAVAASCAIPAFYRPVKIGGRHYVDGGLYSTSNLDIVRNRGLDLVICLNPTSTLYPPRAWNPAEWVAQAWRRASGRRLGNESKKLRAQGTEVVLIQPTGDDLSVMGANLMSRARRHDAIETAIRTVGGQLRDPETKAKLRDLPAGLPHRIARPSGPPDTWPALQAIPPTAEELRESA